jgi:hypothetical protein
MGSGLWIGLGRGLSGSRYCIQTGKSVVMLIWCCLVYGVTGVALLCVVDG